jgi:hypothetical protein
MYNKPELERFGSLREVTQQGWNGWQIDGSFVWGPFTLPTIGKRTS